MNRDVALPAIKGRTSAVKDSSWEIREAGGGGSERCRSGLSYRVNTPSGEHIYLSTRDGRYLRAGLRVVVWVTRVPYSDHGTLSAHRDQPHCRLRVQLHRRVTGGQDGEHSLKPKQARQPAEENARKWGEGAQAVRHGTECCGVVRKGDATPCRATADVPPLIHQLRGPDGPEPRAVLPLLHSTESETAREVRESTE